MLARRGRDPGLRRRAVRPDTKFPADPCAEVLSGDIVLGHAARRARPGQPSCGQQRKLIEEVKR